MHAGSGGRGAGPRVLVLGSGPEALAGFDDAHAAATRLGLRTSVACPAPVPEGTLPFPVRPAEPDYGVLTWPPRPRTMAAALRSTGTAYRRGAPSRWLWAVKSDPWLRDQLGRSDVVVSTDPETDRVLEQVPDLVGGSTVVRSADHREIGRGLRSLADVLGALDDRCADRVVAGRIDRRPLDEEDLVGLRALVDTSLVRRLPPALLPVDLVTDLVRWLAAALGPEHAAVVLLDVLGDVDWAAAPAAGASGLRAQLVTARAWLAPDEDGLPDEQEVLGAASAALAGADSALDAGEAELARGRLVDATGLLFHRELHADTLRSAIVEDPAGHLGGLYASRAFRHLVAGGRRPVLQRVETTPAGTGDAGERTGQRPRVLVLAGAYGAFHGPVVDALSEVAEVTVRRPRQVDRFFLRKGMDPQVLDALAALRRTGPSADQDGWAVERLRQDVRRTLAGRVRRADVVFTDWADRLTVWASHLVPAGCRLVVRIHSLDALHPWFHLVDWSVVDQVVVVSEPLRRLVEQLLEVAGASVPVVVLPNIAALDEADRPKETGARTTLGMVGWGRRVKDPLWALELLEREPSWRLVLIGPDLPGRSASAQAYHQQVADRLAEPSLRDRVEVVGWTDDVAAHLRKVGVILSTSRRESWHLGLVEGAASGAVPVVRDWPLFAPLGGARSLFPEDWVVDTLDEAEARVRAVTAPDAWEDERRRARASALALFDPARAAQRYREVVLGPLLPG